MRKPSMPACSIHQIMFSVRYWATAGFCWFMSGRVLTNQPSSASCAARGAACGSVNGAEDVLVVGVVGGGCRETSRAWAGRPPRGWPADMVGHVIEDELHVAAVELVGEAAVVGQRTQARLDGIHIGGAVAVVVARGRVVLKDRREPDRGDAELLQIVEVIDDALEVAAMVGVRVVAVGRRGAGQAIVGRVAVSEAVRHDEVEDVGGGEAGRRRRACGEGVRGRDAAGAGADLDLHGFRLRGRRCEPELGPVAVG